MKGGQEKTPEVIPTPAGGKGFVDQEKRCTYSQPDKQEFGKIMEEQIDNDV